MRQFREKWVAGAFVQQTGTNAPSSLTGLNATSGVAFTGVASVARLNAASQSAFRDVAAANVTSLADLTVSSLTGASGWRGISQLNSGIVATSVQATAAVSGAVIQLTIYNRLSLVESFVGLEVQSVGAGFFNVKAINSIAPQSLTPFAWTIIR